MTMMIFLIFICVVFCAPPSEQAAHDSMIAPFTGLGVTFGKPPCEEAWTVCENGRVVALNLVGRLQGPFPNLSGFTQLRNLSFLDGFEINPTQSLAAFSFLTTLRHFSVGPALFPIEWKSSALPATIGANWPNLEVFSLNHVKEFPQLPASITSWSKLKVFNLIRVDDELPFPPTFSLPLSLNTWNSIESFLIWDSYVQPAQAIPTLGTKANLTDFELRDTVSDAVIMLPFTSFNDDPLLDSLKLNNFALINMPNCAGTLPATLGHATSLNSFEIDRTAMNGNIPPNVANLKELENFALQGGFTGVIPTTIGGWKSVRAIILFDVKMSGTIPAQIGNLHALEVFYISGVLASPQLSGPFPKELASLVYHNLTTLGIATTQMNGKIPEPDFYDPPAKLTSIILALNSFQCTLPDWLIEIIPSLDSGSCTIVQNDFCLRPIPLQQADITKCSYVESRSCNCAECPNHIVVPCPDCNGVSGGSSSYDACDVCGGNSLSCIDCNGVPNGPSTYDVCNICGGTNECVDCLGFAPGTNVYDQCDVCGGDGTSCLDCDGTPHGTRVYDACDVCGGDGLTCQDCNNGTSGEFEFDLCNDCVNMTIPGYTPDCFDCAGTAGGSLELDLCGVCGGDNSSCNPNEIGAGVVGTKIVIPCLIIFASLDVILLIVYFLLRRKSSAYLVSRTNEKYTFKVKQHEYPISKLIN